MIDVNPIPSPKYVANNNIVTSNIIPAMPTVIPNQLANAIFPAVNAKQPKPLFINILIPKDATVFPTNKDVILFNYIALLLIV
jgi:hypothetical protein